MEIVRCVRGLRSPSIDLSRKSPYRNPMARWFGVNRRSCSHFKYEFRYHAHGFCQQAGRILWNYVQRFHIKDRGKGRNPCLPSNVVHHSGQLRHDGRCRDRQGCGLHRHCRHVYNRVPDHGTVCQIPCCHGAGNGYQCHVLLHCRTHARIHVAGSARRRRHRGTGILHRDRHRCQAEAPRQDPGGCQGGNRGRYRLFHRIHRTSECRNRCR